MYRGVVVVGDDVKSLISVVSDCSNEIVNLLIDEVPVNRSRGREMVEVVKAECCLLTIMLSSVDLASVGNDGNVW